MSLSENITNLINESKDARLSDIENEIAEIDKCIEVLELRKKELSNPQNYNVLKEKLMNRSNKNMIIPFTIGASHDALDNIRGFFFKFNCDKRSEFIIDDYSYNLIKEYDYTLYYLYHHNKNYPHIDTELFMYYSFISNTRNVCSRMGTIALPPPSVKKLINKPELRIHFEIPVRGILGELNKVYSSYTFSVLQ